MSTFTTPLVVTQMELEWRVWKLVEPFEYHVGEYPSNDVVKIPVGFLTDFASVPRIFWAVFPPAGQYGKAAVVHDYLYLVQCYSRRKADSIFLEGMQVLGVRWWKRSTMYFWVRVCGWWPWMNNKYQWFQSKRERWEEKLSREI